MTQDELRIKALAYHYIVGVIDTVDFTEDVDPALVMIRREIERAERATRESVRAA